MKCPICNITLVSIQRLASHLISQHQGETSTITCNIDNCQRTFTNPNSWKTHIYRDKSHRIALGVVKPPSLVQENESALVGCLEQTTPQTPQTCKHLLELSPCDKYSQLHNSFKKNLLSFILKIREEFMLPQSTVDAIMIDIQGLFETFMFGYADVIRDQLAIDSSAESLEFVLNDENFFSTICDSTKTERSLSVALAKYYPHVAPVETILGNSEFGKKHFVHLVEISTMLKSVLAHDDIVGEILSYNAQRKSCESTEVLYDIELKRISSNAISLPIIFYIDEFEPCNPIGSRKKTHKLTGLYFSIAALPPKHRSKLKSIFLHGLVYHSYVVKYGYSSILRLVVADFQRLENELLEVTTKEGKCLRYQVYLQLIAADNLSAHDILGLQKHFNSGKVSRYCNIDYNDLRAKTNFDCTNCPLRTEEQYAADLDKLEKDLDATNINGVIGKCVFSEIPNVKVLKLSPPDVFHDFCEGIIPTVICLSLLNLMHSAKITLLQLNNAIQQFRYGRTDIKNRWGPLISMKNLKLYSITGTGTEKLCLLRMLPLILAQSFAEIDFRTHIGFQLLLKCLDISEIILAPRIKREWLQYLNTLIIEHHQLVWQLDKRALRPKFHYLVHYPELISQYGPPRHYFTMRFESVHQYFKRLTKRTGNFINLTQTLSSRYQNYKAYQLSQTKYFKSEAVHSGKPQLLSSLGPEVVELFQRYLPGRSSEEKLFVANNLELNGMQYNAGSLLVTGMKIEDMDIPEFLYIEKLICCRSKWHILGLKYETVGYREQLHAYHVISTSVRQIIDAGNEIDSTLLSVYEANAIRCVPLKYKVTMHVRNHNYICYIKFNFFL